MSTTDKLVKKEELQKVVRAFLWDSPKTLPSILDKGDIVKYNEFLYEYIGDANKIVNVVNASTFKKVGIRFRKNAFKVDVIDDIETLYKEMYESGVNGDNQGRNWNGTVRNKKYQYPYRYNTFIRIESQYYSSELSIADFIKIMKDFSNTENLEDIFEFPIIINGKSMTKEYIKNYSYLRYKLSDYRTIKLKPQLFNKACEKEYDIISKSNDLDVGMSLKYFSKEGQYDHYLRSYETSYLLNDSPNKKYSSKILRKNENFEFGVFEKVGPLYRDINNEIVPVHFVTEYNNDINNSQMITLNLTFDYPKVSDRGNSVYRFWLPSFWDILDNDTNGESARKMNKENNQYGIYFKLENDGTYIYRFKSVFTDRNQNEENEWGDRYAYYLNDKKVKGWDTYCTWQSKKIDTELSFQILNNEIINVSLKFSEENENTRRFKNEFMETGYKFINNYLYIKVFYAIWSYDDSGSWNEWQFAHIIPPFYLEYKGD